MLIMGKHIFESVKFQWHFIYNTGAILIYFIKKEFNHEDLNQCACCDNA